ncbi:DNA replication factor Cdt1 isoform X1 [Acyrthosiphon pisum]|uniref:CDT1 Geminin-binding domain-containing protein n=1 Tax=Acyrthosiphon pisum TaxID=7029 RepID=A0A8R1W5K7_ACYPI|nr:DNA replication factor Cdt1 isoform X1 [Acyrthosiphon pisum]XP_008180061.1 DNA replication factor Cdt1 isoform X1 [Acyrthosiphon pisum]|eukprot:XP_001948429.2 PREDICTED: DNA replication factor Cdt1 isoform X1 [Acyrthosiphon pisum]
MDTQRTLDCFIKSRKRPTTEDGLHKKESVNNTFAIHKPTRRLSFDCTVQQTIKKQKVDFGIAKSIFQKNLNAGVNNGVAEHILEKKEAKNKQEIYSERATTPDQTPSTKAKLRKELDLGEFRKIVRHKHNLKKLRELISVVDQSQIALNSAESKVKAAKSHYLSSFKSVDLMVDTSPKKVVSSPIKRSQLKPSSLFLSPAQSIVSPKNEMTTQMTQPTEYVSPSNLLDEVGSLMAFSPSKRYAALADSKTLPLPLKYRILDELFKAMETVSSMMFTRKEKITFNKLKRSVQHMTRKNFTEFHLAQIKTVVPDLFKFALVKSPKEKYSQELVIVPNYGSKDEDNIDLIELSIRRKKIFYNALLDIMKEHHEKYLNTLIPPIVIDKNKITRWHPEFDVESVIDIIPSTLPKIEINKPKLETAKDLLDKSHALFAYNNRLNRTLITMNNENKIITEKKFSSTDAKNALKGALKGIPKSFLLKIQEKQAAKAKDLMTRSVGQLKEDRMMNRLPDIARSMRTYFVQLRGNIIPVKKIINQLKQSYPETMTDQEWKAHFSLLQEIAPHWIKSKVIEGIEHIRIDKKVEFEETVIKRLKK